ncbi:MAG: alkaline phosphatase [Bacteroidales bacterium]|nr:alkaline phosphatase [Bacteroidales bacterium]
MKKLHILLLLVFLWMPGMVFCSQDSIKNVILMIPDGCSTALLSMSRQYAQYHDASKTSLAIDRYFCGMVMTHSSDAPIGDSAPTTSCYVTGQPTQTGFVSTYPVKTDHDLYPIDATRAYQPMATVLEAARMLKHKATGLVFTCEFPHATPADNSAHCYYRGKYGAIAPQMVHNHIDVVIGGGTKYLTDQLAEDLKTEGYQVFLNDKKGMQATKTGKMWALFNKTCMEYEIERDPAKEPSLAEMTQKAIDLLSQQKEGFFLMVEGSKVDWAAHDNDVKTAILDFLAFNDAVQVALDFARKDGNTVVLVLPDHGCGGFNMGSRQSNHGYDKLSLEQIMKPLDNYTRSTWTVAEMIKETEIGQIPELMEKYYQIKLTEEELDRIYHSHDFNNSPIAKEERKESSLTKTIARIVYDRTYFGSTTYGHTGEDVFMACYHPQNDRPNGVISNIEVNEYLCRQLGISGQLPALTESIFTSHTTLFPDAKTITIDSLDKDQYRLTVQYKKHKLIANSYDNYVTIDKQIVPLFSVIVYQEKNNTFYLPKELRERLVTNN